MTNITTDGGDPVEEWMASVELLTNEPMQKLLSRASKSAIPPGLRSMVEARAGSFLSSIVLHTDQNRTWIAPQDASEPGPSVSACDSDLIAYEWDAFELYFGREELQGRYAQAVLLLAECVRRYWAGSGFPATLCLIISVQTGRLGNVNARLHLLRGGTPYFRDVHLCRQPTLCAMVMPG